MDAQSVKALVDAKFDKAAQLARDIWNYAELPYEEEKSAAALIAALEQEGFSVEKGVADMPTAFVATFQNGEGGLTIGLLGEYDALSSLSQKAACTVKTPVCEGAPGHGCGHNLLGAGALAGRRCGQGRAGERKQAREGGLLRMPGRGGRRLQAVHGARRLL